MKPSRAALEPYRAPLWLRGGHAQTIYPLLRKGWGRPPLKRERWETPDGDFVDIDWVRAPSHEPRTVTPTPLVVLFHGLEGSSQSQYAVALMRAVAARAWNGAVAHFRGCSGEPNRLPRAYHSGDTEEIDWVLKRFRALQPAGPLFVVGVSLGGNALLKWLGTQEATALEIVDAAAAVCAPVDLTAAGFALGRGFNRIYTAHFLHTLKPKAIAKLQRFPGLYDRKLVLAARSMREFDDAVTAPLHGFRSFSDYWARASSRPWLAHIRVPTLLLNAQNDPFLPASALPQTHEVSRWITLEFPREGGHCGFISGSFPGHTDWMPRRLFGFFESNLRA